MLKEHFYMRQASVEELAEIQANHLKELANIDAIEEEKKETVKQYKEQLKEYHKHEKILRKQLLSGEIEVYVMVEKIADIESGKMRFRDSEGKYIAELERDLEDSERAPLFENTFVFPSDLPEKEPYQPKIEFGESTEKTKKSEKKKKNRKEIAV